MVEGSDPQHFANVVTQLLTLALISFSDEQYSSLTSSAGTIFLCFHRLRYRTCSKTICFLLFLLVILALPWPSSEYCRSQWCLFLVIFLLLATYTSQNINASPSLDTSQLQEWPKASKRRICQDFPPSLAPWRPSLIATSASASTASANSCPCPHRN